MSVQVISNPYSFIIKKNYKSSAEINIEFTYQEWTTPGTYTWTAPFTGTIQVEIAGAGGGSIITSIGNDVNQGANGGNGNLLNIEINIIKNMSYNLSVGKGGAGKIFNNKANNDAEDGENSSFDNNISAGGQGAYTNEKVVTQGANAGNGQGGKGGTANKDSKIANSGANGWVKITKL